MDNFLADFYIFFWWKYQKVEKTPDKLIVTILKTSLIRAKNCPRQDKLTGSGGLKLNDFSL